MTRTQFLDQLRNYLSHLPANEREDIVRDQEEYIRDAMASGRSEADVLASLGDPKAFAANVNAAAKLERAEQSTSLKQQTSSILGVVFALIVLAPLNLIFVLGPFLGVVGILVGGWSVAAAILAATVGVLLAFFLKAIFVSVGFMVHVSTFFFIVGCIGLGILGVIVMTKITEWFLKGTLSYLRWNYNFIRGRA